MVSDAPRLQGLASGVTRGRSMTDAVVRPRPPIPPSVSEQAQRFLAQTIWTDESPPALDDVDGWLRRIERGNDYIRGRFSGLDFPVSADETEIAGVHAYVIRAHDVP